MDTLLSQIYINYLLSDPNTSLIEVWNNRLFVWKYKGSPVFKSSLGLTFSNKIYYRHEQYKQLSKKYHPDVKGSKSLSVSSGHIQSLINDTRQSLEIQDRGYDASSYTRFYSEFNKIVSNKTVQRRNSLIRELSGRLNYCANENGDSFSTKITQAPSFVSSIYKETYGRPLTEKEARELRISTEEWVRAGQAKRRKREIEAWNSCKGTAERPNESNQGQPTIYSTVNPRKQEELRDEYGNVFTMFIGGPCDCGPSKKRRNKQSSSNKNKK